MTYMFGKGQVNVDLVVNSRDRMDLIGSGYVSRDGYHNPQAAWPFVNRCGSTGLNCSSDSDSNAFLLFDLSLLKYKVDSASIRFSGTYEVMTSSDDTPAYLVLDKVDADLDLFSSYYDGGDKNGEKLFQKLESGDEYGRQGFDDEYKP